MIRIAVGQATPIVVTTLDAAVSGVCVTVVLVAGCLVEDDGETRQGRERRGCKRVERLKRIRVGRIIAEDKQLARVDDSGGFGVDGAAGEKQAVESAGLEPIDRPAMEVQFVRAEARG